jgi:hypothetical protein
MQDYDRAADSLEDYLELEPDGEFAADAEDFLDLIDDDDAMFETTACAVTTITRTTRSTILRARCSPAGSKLCVEELEHRLSQTPDSLKIRDS